MRKFAQVTKYDNKVVNVFDWSEEIDPYLGENNLLLDITERKEKPKIGDIYDGKGFVKPVIEEEKPVKEKTAQDMKKDILNLIDELRDKVNRL